MEWLPIESAPKDGHMILVVAFIHGEIDWLSTARRKGGRWEFYSGSEYGDGPPTHWMPLPDPPTP